MSIYDTLPHQDLFLKNKYTKWYFSIIDNVLALNRSRKDGYFEIHHILPKAIYKSFKNLKLNSWNAVLLTPKEHLICHKLLTKCSDNKNFIIKMNEAAFHMMNIDGRKLTTKLYEKIKNSRTISDQTRKRMSESHAGQIPWNKGKVYTEKQKENFKNEKRIKSCIENLMKAKLANIGRKHTEEWKMEASKRGKTRTHSTQSKQKIKQNWKEVRPILTCPHCNISSRNNMKRYHFDNCKLIK